MNQLSFRDLTLRYKGRKYIPASNWIGDVYRTKTYGEAGMPPFADVSNFGVLQFAPEYVGGNGSKGLVEVSSVSTFLKIPHEGLVFLMSLQKANSDEELNEMKNWWGLENPKSRPYMDKLKVGDWQRAKWVAWGQLYLHYGNLAYIDAYKFSNGIEWGRVVCYRKEHMEQNLFIEGLIQRGTGYTVNGEPFSPFGGRLWSPVWSPKDWKSSQPDSSPPIENYWIKMDYLTKVI